jgi:hypothetical protein
VNPPQAAGGGVATLDPLEEAVIAAAVSDIARLHYRLTDDLGGFLPAPVGHGNDFGGHNVVGTGGQPQIPLFQAHNGGTVDAFTFSGGPVTTPPANGQQPVPGLPGVPPTVPPATSNNNVPPANQGFGGAGGGTTTTSGHGGGTTTHGGGSTGGTTTGPGGGTTTRGGGTTTRSTTTGRTTTRSATTTTVVTTKPTTTIPTTTTTGGGGGGGGGGDACNSVEGLSITSDQPDCRFVLVNAKPGDSVHELLTITNTSDSRYTLKLKIEGSQNRLWNDLLLGIWEQGTPPPSTLPPLLFWTTQFSSLRDLDPGESVTYVIDLQLPLSAGNGDMSRSRANPLAALLTFHWKAEG